MIQDEIFTLMECNWQVSKPGDPFKQSVLAWLLTQNGCKMYLTLGAEHYKAN